MTSSPLPRLHYDYLLEYSDEDDELKLDAVQRLLGQQAIPQATSPWPKLTSRANFKPKVLPFATGVLSSLSSAYAVLFSSPLHEAVVAEPTPSVPKGGL